VVQIHLPITERLIQLKTEFVSFHWLSLGPKWIMKQSFKVGAEGWDKVQQWGLG